MPYIETTSNVSIPGRKEQVIKDRMGDAIEKIPGKTESWLMLSFRDNAAMYFKGTDAPCAICQVKLFGGSATEEDYAALTEALTDILREELGVTDEMQFAIGIALGYEADHALNRFRSVRRPVSDCLRFAQ